MLSLHLSITSGHFRSDSNTQHIPFPKKYVESAFSSFTQVDSNGDLPKYIFFHSVLAEEVVKNFRKKISVQTNDSLIAASVILQTHRVHCFPH